MFRPMVTTVPSRRTRRPRPRWSPGRTPCAPRGPRRRGSPARVTTEIRISDVEIISMLMPASDSAANSRAETPGCDFMPAPISESLPMVSSYCSDAKPMSGWCSVRADMPAAPSVAGSVKEMSVRPVAATDTFCTIMSMLTPAAATTSKMRAALPGTSGHADDGDLGLAAVVRDAGDDRLFHNLSFSGGLVGHQGARMSGERRAHVDRYPVPPGVLDAAQHQHLGAARCELEHLVVADPVELAGARARCGGRR